MGDEKYAQQPTTVVGILQNQVMQHQAYRMGLLILQYTGKGRGHLNKCTLTVNFDNIQEIEYSIRT